MTKIKSDFADAVEVRELKDMHYTITFINTGSDKGYVFMVSKPLFDSCLKDRKIIEPKVQTLGELKKKQLNRMRDVS